MNWGVVLFTLLGAGLVVLMYAMGGPANAPGVLIGIALVAGMDLAVYMGERSKRKHLARFGAVLDGGAVKVRGGIFGHRRAEGSFHGRAARLMIRGGGRRQGSYQIAQLACSSPLSFEFWKAAPIRIGRPRYSFETGEPETDRQFTFASRNADRVRMWLVKPENEAKILSMLRQGRPGTNLELKQGFLSLSIRDFWERLEVAELREAAADAPSGAHPGRFIRSDASKKTEDERAAIPLVLENLSQLAVSLEQTA